MWHKGGDAKEFLSRNMTWCVCAGGWWVFEKAGLTCPRSRRGNEVARNMTDTFDFPLMSVSALHRHTSSRSSLAK